MKKNKMEEISRKKRLKAFDYINIVLLTMLMLIIFVPFYSSVVSSFATQQEVVAKKFMLFPSEPVLTSYKVIFETGWVYSGYRVTLTVLILGLIYTMTLTTACAYALSKKSFPGKNLFLNLIIFTMFFGGGLIPFYILVIKLGLTNSLGALILPSGVSTFYMLLMRNFFQSIPEELKDSAKIDGANEMQILIRIILPVSMPIIATIVLFTSVDYWNDWFKALLFINEKSKWPLQLALRNILTSFKFETSMSGAQLEMIARDIYFDGIKMAAVVVTMTPIMLFYPFVQKYFVKGIMIGALKG